MDSHPNFRHFFKSHSHYILTIMQNAKFLERFVSYREPQAIHFAKMLLSQKIKYQFAVIRQNRIGKQYLDEISQTNALSLLILIEARAARRYWKYFGNAIYGKADWNGRIPHAHDSANALLDIGYHYLAGKIIKECDALYIPTELGIFHKAQSRNAHPLAYDFMEWLRPFLVDRTLMKIIRKKKKKISEIDQKAIAYFLSAVKKEFDIRYYHKKLRYCVTLNFWIRLMLLEMMKSVYRGIPYAPLFPSLRHETRCKKTASSSEAAT